MLRFIRSRPQFALGSLAPNRALASSGASVATTFRVGAALGTSLARSQVPTGRTLSMTPPSSAAQTRLVVRESGPMPSNAGSASQIPGNVVIPPLPTKQRVPFTTVLLEQTPDKGNAQLRLESWSRDVFRRVEEARRERRERDFQPSPKAYKYIAQDLGFQSFIWFWTFTIEERLNIYGLKGLSAESQRFLNQNYQDEQIFSNQDLARIIVSTVIDNLVKKVSNPSYFGDFAKQSPPAMGAAKSAVTSNIATPLPPDAEMTEALQKDGAPASPLSAENKTSRALADESSFEWAQPFDVRLIDIALDLGKTVERELKVRVAGRKSLRNGGQNNDLSLPQPGQPVPSTKFSRADHVRLGGDLLFLSQEHELELPSSDGRATYGNTKTVEKVIGRPWTKHYVKFPGAPNLGKHKTPSVIRFHSELLKLVEVVEDAGTGHRDMPMLVPPLPATRTEDGGYLSLSRKFLNARESKARNEAVRLARESGQMDEMLQAINFLSSIPWRVSHTVLDDLERLWPDTMKLPSHIKHIQGIAGLSITPEDKTAVDIARAFRDVPFYNFVRPDYRGRIYPSTTELSPVANDLARSLLVFDTKKVLGKEGWRALKLHLAGLFGATKRASFDERLAWIDDHWADIIDSGTKGLDGDRWYLTGDHGWQVRATCAEIARAAAYPDGPEAYPSDLPCHQDGSCNGLQHYAALARDVEGGSAVNLLPSERPADVYTTVLSRVIEQVEMDAKSGNSSAKFLLQHREKTMVRDSVKRTVMTRVYGLTSEGALRHAADFLTKIGLSERTPVIARYWSNVTLTSIEGLFPRATAIQQWLLTCAHLILRSEGVDDEGYTIAEGDITMSWTTPLGFPVIQDIRIFKSKSVMSAAGRISIQDPDDPSEVVLRKETDAFAPNVIHSFDAAHLFRAALNCRAHGITMGTVHDSFWTHAADIDLLRDITRLTFVSQYSDDILENLRNEFILRYGDNVVKKTVVQSLKRKHYYKYQLPSELSSESDGEQPLDAWATWGSHNPLEEVQTIRSLLPPCPSNGDLDIQKVKDSDFFFH